jgi:hypothetical protein
MRFILASISAVLLISTPVAQALAQATPKQAQAEIPSEFKGFFDDLSQLTKRYPGISNRFFVGDRKSTLTRIRASLKVIYVALASVVAAWSMRAAGGVRSARGAFPDKRALSAVPNFGD